MSFGGQIGQHRSNARGSEREKSLSQEDLTAPQVSHDPAIARQGVRLLAGILTLLFIAFCYFASSVCITVVVATSGDTGGAAVEAFRGRACTDLFVLFPQGRISA